MRLFLRQSPTPFSARRILRALNGSPALSSLLDASRRYLLQILRQRRHQSRSDPREPPVAAFAGLAVEIDVGAVHARLHDNIQVIALHHPDHFDALELVALEPVRV